MPLSLEQLLHRLGGVAPRGQLIELTSRAEVDRALREGRVVRVGRGRYALPTADEARCAAAALHGVVSHRSAAAAFGWEMKTLPAKPCVTVRRSRTLDEVKRAMAEPHWVDLDETDVLDGWITTPQRTFVDCCRDLPFDEALAIADSALRNHGLTELEIVQLAETMRGPGRQQVRRVAQEATRLAANPFESVLRAIALDIPGLSLRPQVLLLDKPFPVRPDLVDERLRLAIEAESFEWHGSRAALARDCRRYTLLAIHGWSLMRFSWEDVMLRPSYVREALAAKVAAVVDQGAQLPCPVCSHV